jgi:hypothetical protein
MRVIAVVSFFLGSTSALAAPAADWSTAYFGVPVPVLLAAFGGAGLVLSLIPHADPDPHATSWRDAFAAIGGICFCTLAGAYGAPVAVRWLAKQDEAFSGAQLLSAFLVAALIQALPFIVNNRREILQLIGDLWPSWGKKQ